MRRGETYEWNMNSLTGLAAWPSHDNVVDIDWQFLACKKLWQRGTIRFSYPWEVTLGTWPGLATPRVVAKHESWMKDSEVSVASLFKCNENIYVAVAVTMWCASSQRHYF